MDQSPSTPRGDRSKTISENEGKGAPASQRPRTTGGGHNPERRKKSALERLRESQSAYQTNCHWTRGQRPVSSVNDPDQGFDNSERNKDRRNLGSCTDHVADDRRVFGPWLKPDNARQSRLVERLAPYKPPAPPDPKFDNWVNHFEYYWNIGVDIKPKRSPRKHDTSRDGSHGDSGSNNNNNGHYRSQYHRMLKRPRTTHGRLASGSSGSDGEHNMSGSSSGNGERFGRETQSARPGYYGRDSESGSDRSNKGYVVSGMDRRYMGLQSVNSGQMRQIVTRLTRLTSAYNAKFAPNPHVWKDNSPGAHMVKERANTIA